MSADVIAFKGPGAKRTRHRRASKQPYVAGSLVWEAREALRMVRFAIERRAENPAGVDWLQTAERALAAGIAAHTAAAKRDVQRIVMDAFGPDMTCGEIKGARRALSLILQALPAYDD